MGFPAGGLGSAPGAFLAGSRPGEHPAQPQAESPPPSPSGGSPVTPPGNSQTDTKGSRTGLLFGSCPPLPFPGQYSFLCDRLTLVVPVLVLPGEAPPLGWTYWIDGDGCLESFKHRRRMVEGSWSGRVSVEVHPCPRLNPLLLARAGQEGRELVWLRLDGNPAKWFQRHNVFGSSEVWGLARDMVRTVLDAIGFPGEVVLSAAYLNRVDATYNFDLGSSASAGSLVRQLSRFASVSHRRSSGFETSLLFPGRAASLSIYHKGPEMRAHPPKDDPSEDLLAVADRIVRFEVVSRSETLDVQSLRRLSAWRYDSSVSLLRLWWAFVERLRFPAMSEFDLSALSGAARRMYGVWLSGEDPRAFASRMTVYRHRLAILQAGGPDIHLPRPSGDVVEFRRTLVAVPAVLPASLAGSVYSPRAA